MAYVAHREVTGAEATSRRSAKLHQLASLFARGALTTALVDVGLGHPVAQAALAYAEISPQGLAGTESRKSG